MNHEDGELSLQQRVDKLNKMPNQAAALLAELESTTPRNLAEAAAEMESADHFDNDNYHDYVGDYKDLPRYEAVGNTNGITLGFEIECAYRHDTTNYDDYYDSEDNYYIDQSANDALAAIARSMNKGYILAERDGSLEDTGVEFITGYCTWESHKPRMERFFKEYINDFKDSGAAGIHIHVGRNESTTELNWRSFYWFIMCDENKPLIKHVARRYGGSYYHANRTYNRGGEIRSDSRYDAVNKRDYTWELRMFASTTDWTQMQQYVEFCVASVEFLIKNNVASLKWMGGTTTDFENSPLYYKRFNEWVSTQAARFPNLGKHLEKM